jgi:hypothetical protein
MKVHISLNRLTPTWLSIFRSCLHQLRGMKNPRSFAMRILCLSPEARQRWTWAHLLRKKNRSFRSFIPSHRKTMELQRPPRRNEAVLPRLRVVRNLIQQCHWFVVTVHTALSSDSHINISVYFICIARGKLLTWHSRHRKRHDRPLKCNVSDCQLKFAFNRDLKRHIASKHPYATNQEQYYCHHSNCDRARTGLRGGFPRKDTLTRHLRTHQKRKETENEPR